MILSDRGEGYVVLFQDFCSEFGIVHQTMVSYSPQSNGIAKCTYQTLKETMNAMLISSKLVEWSYTFCKSNHTKVRLKYIMSYRMV